MERRREGGREYPSQTIYFRTVRSIGGAPRARIFHLPYLSVRCYCSVLSASHLNLLPLSLSASGQFFYLFLFGSKDPHELELVEDREKTLYQPFVCPFGSFWLVFAAFGCKSIRLNFLCALFDSIWCPGGAVLELLRPESKRERDLGARERF